MKNRDVFTIFRRHIDPVALELGFQSRRNTGADVPWIRKLGNRRHELVWIQMDKWPWDIWMGSQFTVNFQNSRSPEPNLSRGTKAARIGDLLKGKYKKEAERIQNQAIAKMRVPTPAEFEAEFGLIADELDLEEYREKSQPVKFGRRLGDVWLRIVDADDVTAWAAFLAAWLPEGLRAFAKSGDKYKC